MDLDKFINAFNSREVKEFNLFSYLIKYLKDNTDLKLNSIVMSSYTDEEEMEKRDLIIKVNCHNEYDKDINFSFINSINISEHESFIKRIEE